MRAVVAAALLSLSGLLPAHAWAATLISNVPGAPDPGDTGGLTIDFEGALPSGISFAAGSTYQILQGFVAKKGYNPAGDLTHYLSVPGGGAPGSATLDFTGYTGGKLGNFSLYWGSIDRANTLDIITSAGTLTVLGSDLITAGFGSATSARGNRRVGFSLADSETLLGLKFSSPTSFELDDIVFQVAPVPEPATWMMMIAGLGVVGGMARRRPKKLSVA